MSEPLCNVENEQRLLGAIFLDNRLVADVTGWLRPEHFYEPIHGLLYDTMCRLWREGRAFIPDTLIALFADQPAVGCYTFAEYLKRLAASATSLKAIEERGRSIKDLADRRALAVIGTQIQELAINQSVGVLQTASEAVTGLDEIISSSRPKRSCMTAYEAAGDLLDDLESGASRIAISTGLADLDRVTGGWNYNELAIVGARPSMGKSTFMIQAAIPPAKAGKGVLLFSLEMPQDAVSARMLSSLVWNSMTPIPYTDILKSQVKMEYDRDRLRQAREKQKGWPLEIDNQAGLTVSEIMARSRQAAAKFQRDGKTLDLIPVDHIGKIRPSSRYAGNLVAEIGEISNGLATLAKDLGVAVVAASQLNRDVTKRDNKRPQLSDIRESGHIEQDADLVAFVHRDVYYAQNSGKDEDAEMIENIKNEMEFIIAKNRNGPVTTVKLFADMGSNVVRNKAP
jgi:replicative DNA helicase